MLRVAHRMAVVGLYAAAIVLPTSADQNTPISGFLEDWLEGNEKAITNAFFRGGTNRFPDIPWSSFGGGGSYDDSWTNSLKSGAFYSYTNWLTAAEFVAYTNALTAWLSSVGSTSVTALALAQWTSNRVAEVGSTGVTALALAQWTSNRVAEVGSTSVTALARANLGITNEQTGVTLGLTSNTTGGAAGTTNALTSSGLIDISTSLIRAGMALTNATPSGSGTVVTGVVASGGQVVAQLGTVVAGDWTTLYYTNLIALSTGWTVGNTAWAYDEYEMEGRMLTDRTAASGFDRIGVRINGDSSAVYDCAEAYQNPAGWGSPGFTLLSGAASTALRIYCGAKAFPWNTNSLTHYRCVIRTPPSPQLVGYYAESFGEATNSQMQLAFSFGAYRTPGVVTQFTILPVLGTNFLPQGTWRLRGRSISQ